MLTGGWRAVRVDAAERACRPMLADAGGCGIRTGVAGRCRRYRRMRAVPSDGCGQYGRMRAMQVDAGGCSETLMIEFRLCHVCTV